MVLSVASAARSALEPSYDQAAVYADRALAMMRSLGVGPTPKHYAVFFACAAGQPTELVCEVEMAVSQHDTFSDDFIDRLYNVYIAQEQTRHVQDTVANAKKILHDVSQNVNHFTGATQAVSHDVTSKLKNLDEGASEADVRLLANSLVVSAQSIKNSGDHVNAQLVDAQKEIANLRENLARVMTEADRDFLTGCFNRKAFDKRLAEAIELAPAGAGELTMLMLDIDHFKIFNDKHGHLVGDEVLKIVAKTLTDQVKGQDFVARFGGEEFAVILPSTPVGGGMIVANTIRKAVAVRELRRKATGESLGAITVSVGVACWRAKDTADTFVTRADEAMYRSKKSGRNCVTQENLSE